MLLGGGDMTVNEIQSLDHCAREVIQVLTFYIGVVLDM